jgi:hypothetical protein
VLSGSEPNGPVAKSEQAMAQTETLWKLIPRAKDGKFREDQSSRQYAAKPCKPPSRPKPLF